MIAERITNTVATAAVASPWWLPSLADVSHTAGLLLPILGVVWLTVQIVTRLGGRK